MRIKQGILRQITALAEKNLITQQELDSAFLLGKTINTKPATRKFNVMEWFYYLGGAIVFLGIAILLRQHWASLSFGTKLFATLGSGMAAYVSGYLFYQDLRTERVSVGFFLIFALITPIGFGVILDHAGMDIDSDGMQSLISGVMLVGFLLSQRIIRTNIMRLGSILFSTWFFFSLTNMLASGNVHFMGGKFDEYRVLAMGITYLLLGYSISKEEAHTPLVDFLYQIGVISFLGSTFFLGGWKPHQVLFWELMYPVLVIGLFFVSIATKIKAFLSWSSLFLMAYILKITTEYFSASLGWPLTLVIAGLAMITISYLSLFIKKKLSGCVMR